MITMEFEEMKKVWDEQNQEQLYAINEAALHKNIQSKKKRASRISNINDFGLIAIAIGTAMLYSFISIINETPAIYDYLIPLILIAIAGYVLAGRIRRKKQERRFDRTMLGELDHAIANVSYEAKRSKTMVWWFILPLAIPSLLNMIQEGAGWLPMILIAGAFLLSYAVLRWEFNRCHLPKKQRLEVLRSDGLLSGSGAPYYTKVSRGRLLRNRKSLCTPAERRELGRAAEQHDQIESFAFRTGGSERD